MVENEQREHERIEIRMPTRMWLDEPLKGKPIVFEGYAQTRDLAIGGTFLESTYLLPIGFPLNLEMRLEDGSALVARGEVVHRIEPGSPMGRETGMGILFTEVDSENRERLLRFFVSGRIQEFYEQRFVVEFPHLESVLSLKDVALVINLWEDKEGRLTSLRKGQERGETTRGPSSGGRNLAAAKATTPQQGRPALNR
jgi:hypothetical protein